MFIIIGMFSASQNLQNLHITFWDRIENPFNISQYAKPPQDIIEFKRPPCDNAESTKSRNNIPKFTKPCNNISAESTKFTR